VGVNSIPTVLAWVPSGWELILILAVIILLFGAKKLPELFRSVGQSIKEFKKGVKEADTEEKPEAKTETPKKGNGQS
jgi:sec-independent protein translocase protein TatA